MRSAQKKSPISEKKNGKEQTSGKKLVQARLPFKIVSGAVASPSVNSNAPTEIENVPKKRKLSYEEECENPTKKIGKSESTDVTSRKDDKAADEDVIVLEDDEPEKVSEPKTPTTSKTPTRTRKSILNSAGKNNTPKVQIKLPISSKKKRRKVNPTLKSGKEASDSSDVEIVEEEKSFKKIKLSEEDSLKVESNDTEENAVKCPATTNKKTPASSQSSSSETSPTLKSNATKKNLTEEKHQEQSESVKSEKSSFKKPPIATVKKSEMSSQKSSTTPKIEKLKTTSSSNNSPARETPKNSEKKIAETESNSETADGKELRNSPNKKTIQDDETDKKTPVRQKQVKQISQLNNSPHLKTPKTSEKKIAEAESDSETADCKELRSSPNKKYIQDDKTDKKTPVRQKQLKVSLKRVRSPVENEKPKVSTDSINETSDEQSPPQNSENAENLNSTAVSLSDTDDELDLSISADTSISSIGKKVLTPKQLKLMERRQKAREEKERKLNQLKEERNRSKQKLQEERERKIQEEKNQKQKEREERESQKRKEREEKDEQKRREREEKEELKRKEREDRERKRLSEIEAKNEEKRKRDEAKEEERRKKEEERRRKELEKEEEENKKKKAAQAFTKFFVPKPAKPYAEEDQESKDDMEITDCLAFRPFQVKGDMKLAPLVRRNFNKSSREKLDSFVKHAPSQSPVLYLKELKSGKHVPLKGSKTVLKNNDDEVIIIENELENAAEAISEARPKTFEKCRAKFLFFRENRRPPYYGTWRKKSSVITPRKPFGTDKGFFDYEVDSDDEWEEEEPGESLNGSDDEKEESEDDDYEVDNEWFVPHGHLSDEELQNEDELGPDTSREAQKAKLKALQQEFAQEMKKKTEKIKPRLFGAIWEDENGNKPKACPEIIWETLCARAMIVCETPLVEEPPAPEQEPSTPPPEKIKRLEINDDLTIQLIRLLHGNRHSRAFLIKEYIEHVRKTCESIKSGECMVPTKAVIKEKIDEISGWTAVDDSNAKTKKKKKLCWVVSKDILKKYSLNKLALKNEWSYTLRPRFDGPQESASNTEAPEESLDEEKSEKPKSEENDKKKPASSGITKFAKVLTTEEKKKILSRNSFGGNTPVKANKTEISKPSPKSVQKKTKVLATEEEKKMLSKNSFDDNTPVKATNAEISKPAPKSVQKTDKTADTKKAESSPSTAPVAKKRVALLMSVPPGQDFPTKSKNALISKFLETNKAKKSSQKSDPNSSSYLKDEDGAVVID